MAINLKTASNAERKAEYDRIAKEIGDDQFFTRRELNYLPEILQDNEQILAFTSGLMDGNTWLLTLTDRRIIFLDKGMIFGLKQQSIPLNKINAISCKTGLFFGVILITEGSATHKIENVWKKTVKIFTNKAQDAMCVPVTNVAVTQSGNAGADKYAQLEKLAELKDKGIISAQEYDAEKAKILNG